MSWTLHHVWMRRCNTFCLSWRSASCLLVRNPLSSLTSRWRRYLPTIRKKIQLNSDILLTGCPPSRRQSTKMPTVTYAASSWANSKWTSCSVIPWITFLKKPWILNNINLTTLWFLIQVWSRCVGVPCNDHRFPLFDSGGTECCRCEGALRPPTWRAQ